MNKKTQKGSRPDLVKIEVNAPQGYIGHRIFPVLKRAKKSGTVYYGQVTADDAAQTGRTAGNAPNATILTSTKTTFVAAERIKRYAIPFDEVEQLGGIAAADRKGASASKRSCMRSIEADHAIKLLGIANASTTDVGTDIIAAVKAGVKAVKRYAGKTALVCSEEAYELIIQNQAVKDAFVDRYGKLAVSTMESLSDVNRSMLASVLGVKEVIIGDDDHWAATVGTAEGAAQDATDLGARAAVVKIAPDNLDERIEELAVLGATVQYSPENGPFDITSFADENDKLNKYDAQGFDDIKVLNSGASFVLAGVDATMNA